MILKLGMYHWGLKLYKFYINDDWVELDLIYGKVKVGHLYVRMWKTVIKSFN